MKTERPFGNSSLPTTQPSGSYRHFLADLHGLSCGSRGCGYASQMVLCAKESLDKIKFDWRGFYQSRQSPHFALAELNRADRESMR